MRAELARGEDLPAVDELLEQGREYLASQGIDQWQNFPPTPQDTREHFRRGEL